ncbi:BTB/POZ and MATH domain-containing protein 2-like [Lolium rigidum]|uniref:BTB/POZ and MATH domain-containing protein 2-like n=1 Tax=Lolium rigidum TaxID=89674 RepID=UPI001F5C8A72|nr:BTB/POZ and MATH domain-containing protein 2-like [Lolium rigidum]
MAFAGVSVIANGKLLAGTTTPPAVNAAAAAASGYHLLVVEGYSRTYSRVGESITSRSFTIGGHRWCIYYYPEGCYEDDAGFVSLLLSKQGVAKVQFQFSFIDETEKQDPARIRASRIFHRGYVEISKRFMKRDDLQKSKHFKDDGFTIRCDVVVADEYVTPPLIDVPPSAMKQNFTDLLMAGEGTDVVFQVGGETISAHRCVLAARSAVFKALLFGPMKEGTSTAAVVQIENMDATVFKALLGFIYGDSLATPAEAKGEEVVSDDQSVLLLQHLLVAADRYDIRRLRVMCEKRLSEHISVSTSTTILALAEQHQCHGLKEACYKFLRCPANLKAVVATEGFDHLCKSCTPVMKDLVFAMLQAPK